MAMPTTLSDDDLARIFEQLDVDKKGVISLDILRTFAKQSGLEDLGSLEVLDFENNGRITFANFVKGVRTLQGEVPETPRIQRRTVEPNIAAEDANGINSEDETDEDNSIILQHNRTHDTIRENDRSSGGGSELASHPDVMLDVSSIPSDQDEFEPLSPQSLASRDVDADSGWSSKHASQSSPRNRRTSRSSSLERQIQDQEAKILELHQLVEDVQFEHRSDKDEIDDLRAKCKRLEQRCAEYEAQLDGVEEQLEHSRVDEMNTTCTQLRREKEEIQKELTARCAELEESLATVSSERDRLKEDHDVLKHSMREEQQVTKQLRLHVIELQGTIAALETDREQTIEGIKTQTEGALEASLSEQAQKFESEIEELQSELETLRHRHAVEMKEMESQRTALEQELQQAHQDHKRLEKKHSELERQLIHKGMELAAAPTRDDESLAAQMSDASRDDLMRDLREQEERLRQQQAYIGHLLNHVIERIPDVLEIK
ncbi:hypothetical protein PTSG_06389 [Salpingoeca rosetta]|uniref:EF-hand domain-containing protein n=1 Tax=Salpingoeca rosetta (strain ATCC 50818 / BSB-021) TaxID=946362 RepID=F2UCS1_SALR5|nr:uncharacterized protein PTSG_06389 [Salpingoeca rosetta]EGD74378.1 hypothetical protein PTSG_06389 [Salpingoeca rosetta]|eukprot:XP_004993278.1 hypothetical protein PTSG_06389 [Salpingoeca rosetta]